MIWARQAQFLSIRVSTIYSSLDKPEIKHSVRQVTAARRRGREKELSRWVKFVLALPCSLSCRGIRSEAASVRSLLFLFPLGFYRLITWKRGVPSTDRCCYCFKLFFNEKAMMIDQQNEHVSPSRSCLFTSVLRLDMSKRCCCSFDQSTTSIRGWISFPSREKINSIRVVSPLFCSQQVMCPCLC